MSAAVVTVLSQKQVMKRLGVSRTTLWRWRRAGKIRSYHLSPRKIGYSLMHIQTLLENCEKGASNGEG